jgi:hypothetical protein
MTGSTIRDMDRLSALRLVSYVPPARDAVHVGLLTPDAQQVIDLAPLGISDALDALDQLDMLRRAAGAIVHGAARVAAPVQGLHLVAPIPLVRTVVGAADGSKPPRFLDPVSVHGPGGHLSRADARTARAGLGTIIGLTIAATTHCPDDVLERALVGSTLVLGWEQPDADGVPMLKSGAIGPFLAIPRRRPESLMFTHVAPLGAADGAERKTSALAPGSDAFFALARAALRSHTLRPGDLLTIFPADATRGDEPVEGGSWVRVSAPGLATLSLAVR